jgi:hypothetical protein
MPDVLSLEFSKPAATEISHAANRRIGMDPNEGSGDWPDGMMSRVAGESGDTPTVAEVWESRPAQEAFVHSRLRPVFTHADVPPPTRAEWFAHAGLKDRRHARERPRHRAGELAMRPTAARTP